MGTKDDLLFRKIYLVSPVKDFSALSRYCTQVIFVTNGKEQQVSLPPQIRSILSEFEPETDAIVASGRSNAVLMTGMILKELFPQDEIWVGIYQSSFVDTPQYQWITLGGGHNGQ